MPLVSSGSRTTHSSGTNQRTWRDFVKKVSFFSNNHGQPNDWSSKVTCCVLIIVALIYIILLGVAFAVLVRPRIYAHNISYSVSEDKEPSQWINLVKLSSQSLKPPTSNNQKPFRPSLVDPYNHNIIPRSRGLGNP